MLRLLAALLGPIFAKEAVEIARRKRYYFNRLLYGAALLVALLIIWEDYGGRLSAGGSTAIRAMARMAAEFFLYICIIQFGAVFLFVPLFLCGVVASEREERTLELLFTTRLTDSQIVLGKLGSRMAALVTLILCGLPVMGMLLFFGGVGPEAVWKVAAITLLAMLFAGAHAIYFSVVTKSPLGAMVRSYWWMAIWMLGVPIMGMLFLLAITPSRAGTTTLQHWFLGGVFLTNPLALFVTTVEPEANRFLVATFGPWHFAAGFVLPTLWSIFLIWRAVRRLRREPVPFAQFWRRLSPLRALGDGWDQLTSDWYRFWPRKPVRNPLWQRARTSRVYDREGYIGRIQWLSWLVVFSFLVLMAIVEPNALDEEELAIAFLGCTWGGICLVGALMAGASLIGDRRRGFLDLLLVTPLSGQEILDGTLLAVWEHLRRALPLPFLLAGFFCLTDASRPIGAFCSLVTATLFLALVFLYGVGFSLTARSFPAGLIATFLLPVLTIVGTLVLIGLAENGHALILWPLSFAALGVGWRLTRWNQGIASVSCFLLGLHFAMACVGSCWTIHANQDQWPGAAMHPGFLTLVLMDDNFAREFRDVGPWQAVIWSYWTVLIGNFIVARWWLIRHFDRLAERLGGERSPQVVVAEIVEPIRQSPPTPRPDAVAAP
jgi:ABC-type transport system involved in multi-copper enzyme maturation permease subunit